MTRFGLAFPGREQALAAALARPKLAFELDEARSIRGERAQHVFIEGDNLAVLQALSRAYFEQVQLIYIDPPYNTGNDFVYRDRFQESRSAHLERTGQVDAETKARLVANPSTEGRFHSTWLSMMLARLRVARQLLRPDGVLMCSIDDHEVHRLRLLLDEVLGEQCFIAQIVVVTNRGGRDYLKIATGHEYLLVYGATPDTPIRELPREVKTEFADDRGPFELRELRNRNPKFHPGNRPNLDYPVFVQPGDGLCSVALEPSDVHSVRVDPRNRHDGGSVWRWGKDRVRAHLVPGNVEASDVVARRRRRDGRFNIYEKLRKTSTKPRALWDEPMFRTEMGTADLRRRIGDLVFEHPKPVALIRRCLAMATDHDGIVMDFFAGSGTTMDAVLEQNAADGGDRRCVCVQVDAETPEQSRAREAGFTTIPAVSRARIAAAMANKPEVGVRWFRTHSIEPLSAIDHGQESDAQVYWHRLVEHERARAARFSSVWSAMIHEGFRLDACVEHLDGWWLVTQGERCLAVDAGGLEFPSLPDGSAVVCRDHRLDDVVFRRWAEPHRVLRGESLAE